LGSHATLTEASVDYKLFGLPTHILVIHLVVVIIPLASLATVAMALRPAWRLGRIGVGIVTLDILAAAGTYIARLTGLAFYDNQKFLRQSQAVQNHKALGLTLIWYLLGLVLAAILLVLAEKYERPPLTTVFAFIALAAAVAATVQTVRVGDAGVRATYGSVVSTSS
jgi:hypothetical protein